MQGSSTHALLELCEKYCKSTKTTEWSLGESIGNKNVIKLMREGKTVTLNTADRIKKVIASYPDGIHGGKMVTRIRESLKGRDIENAVD